LANGPHPKVGLGHVVNHLHRNKCRNVFVGPDCSERVTYRGLGNALCTEKATTKARSEGTLL
jgi:hypothetical protein